MDKIIDAHIHLDQYTDEHIKHILNDLNQVHCTDLISVSMDLASSKKNKQLAQLYPQVKPAFGFHPEQQLPSESEVDTFLTWMADNKENMVAIGEVGLPYYLRTESNDASFPQDEYIELLDSFLEKAAAWEKPVILHAVYDDAPIVCDLLEKHSIQKAHFHWFKSDEVTTDRMIANGYYISVTPDIVYEREIQNLVKRYPLDLMMVETDGPWQFEEIFANDRTHPRMIHSTVSVISQVTSIPLSDVYRSLYANTNQFYNLQAFQKSQSL